MTLILFASPAFANTCSKLLNATEDQLDTLIVGLEGTGQDVCGTAPEMQIKLMS
jgi:hypothetical protein